ncbi:BaiN/RdsA family NAD(P)/FAD-dependent oxidoreductase [Criibacterium bergeronii]|uniref:Aminoacetone oxidase family FAD-binding enzyme n=1 Tax=Criibacterium bergeronii TaxID=1871336 RepID=A0A371INX3_9FIRM|nr:aminoacetone oxidase family FAD-binding enzyme [Criibacterium bergeronii]MBS6062429.1 aminoacetone oxidase family FAD-binding enzyme [Peptostreptococcaceae bacterium]RDY22179.1 aminoacetone oxidase family FAD-binding enzyme [Criibacterium bergeronii]
MKKQKTILIIGGGAAGIFAALTAKTEENDVIIIEKNKALGQKLAITGSGRCNVTNLDSKEDFFDNINTNAKFFYSAFSNFSNYDMIAYLEKIGVGVKCEGNKAYPANESAQKLVNSFIRQLENKDVKIHTGEELIDFEISDEDGKKMVSSLKTTNGKYEYKNDFDYVIIATGGLSYTINKTFKLLKQKNIKITKMYPSLTGIDTVEDYSELQGLSIQNVTVSADVGDKIYAQTSDMLFTKNGISGPCVIKLTGKISGFQDINDMKIDNCFPYKTDKKLAEKQKYITYKSKPIFIKLDFLPSISSEQLENLLFNNQKQLLKTKLSQYLPHRLCKFLLEKYDKTDVNNLKKEQKLKILQEIKEHRLQVKNYGNISSATVTKGGIDILQISPKTMNFKGIDNLYFAGECLDIDAQSGGYNLQIAFSTGYTAGLNFR